MDAVIVQLSSDEENEQRASNMRVMSNSDELITEYMQSSSAMNFVDLYNNNSQEPATTSLFIGSFDIESVKGKFGWDLRLNGTLPYIIRWVNGVEQVQYFSVYHAEKFLLANYLAFINGTVISTCMAVHGYHMTNPEATLLTEINKNHCDPVENYEFKAGQDCIISAKDMYKFYKFLKTCYDKLKSPIFCNVPFGFVCFNTMVVPYVIKDDTKYLPLTFFEETANSNCIHILQHLMRLTIPLSSLKLAYIKFCCMVQGIKTDYISRMQLSIVISLEELKRHFTVNTDIYLYWPVGNKISSQVFNKSQCVGKWIKEPRSLPSSTLFECNNDANTIVVNQDKVTDDNSELMTMPANSDTTFVASRPENSRRRRQPIPFTECLTVDNTVMFTPVLRKRIRLNPRSPVVYTLDENLHVIKIVNLDLEDMDDLDDVNDMNDDNDDDDDDDDDPSATTSSFSVI